MTDFRDEHTPLPRPIWATEEHCFARYKRTEDTLTEIRDLLHQCDRRLIALVGCDGDNGKISSLAERQIDHEDRIRRVEKAAIMGRIATTIGAAVGSGILVAIANYLVRR